jgi:hypothetical protein
MRFPVFFANRQPIPKSSMEAICLVACLGMIAQTIYSYRKGVIYFGHPDGGIGPASWGTPYIRISRSADPKRFWQIFALHVFLSLAFLAALIGVHVCYHA